MNKKSLQHVLIILVAFSLTTLVAIAGSQGGVRIGEWPLLLLCVALAFGIQWLAFIPAYLAQTEHFFDLTGSLTFVSLAMIALVLSDAPDTRAIILCALISVWAIRLGSFLFKRVKKDGSDGRFDEIKPVPTRFFLTWTLQGAWVFLTLSAALAAMTTSVRLPLGPLAWLGIMLWLTGFTIEVIADAQKRVFRKNTANNGRFITSGLWAWSRHPNYFGEITLWLGVALIAAPVLSGWQWLTMISPLFVVFLLTKVSGIPLLEARAENRWGNDAEYQAYKARTSRLIPWPQKKQAT